MTTLAPGSPAPDFSTRNHHGEEIRLSELRGRPTLLVFYPWAFSGICTRELAEIQDHNSMFQAVDVSVLAISCDAMYALRAFADDQQFEFDLLTDHWPHGAIARAYGVFDEGTGVSLRGSFLVDAAGVLRWRIVNGIGEGRVIAEHLEALR